MDFRIELDENGEIVRKNIIIIFLLILNLNLSSHQNRNIINFAEIKKPYKTISPFISKLLNIKKSERVSFLDEFISSSKNLPLLEEDPLDNDFIYLTFLYFNSENNIEISLDVNGIYEDNSLGNRKLRHLNGTDLYYRAYKVPKDICLSYRFNIYDKATGNSFKEIDRFNENKIPLDRDENYSFSVVDLNKNDKNLIELNRKEIASQSRIDTLQYVDSVVNTKRNCYIYLPPDYDKNLKEEYTTIYLFDAFIYLNRVEVFNILDNLISKDKCEPVICVLFGTQKSTRENVLVFNKKFLDEFACKFVPLIRKNIELLKNLKTI